MSRSLDRKMERLQRILTSMAAFHDARKQVVHSPERKKAEESLHEFIKQAWHVLEPATEYVDGWHIQAMCDHLEAVTNGHIRNLIINVPPRHMKSLTVSVFWPMWVWTRQPATRWLFCSYAQKLSTRDSLKRRRLLQSPWYRQNWGHVFRLTSDQNEKSRFENNHAGYCLATSVDGSNTGEGADIIVCDDPHNVRDRESEIMRENVITWWSEVMSTRLNNPKTGRRVLIMQRLHEGDLCGHLLRKGGWDHLCLRAEYEEEP